MQRSASRWVYIAPSIFIIWFLSNFDKNSLSFFVTNSNFLNTLHLAGKPAEIGLLLSIFVWPYGICNFIWGFIVDRWGPRRIAVVSIIGWALAMVVGGLAYGFGMLIVSRIILAMAESALWPISLKLTASWFPHPERARAQSTYFYGQVLGFLVGAFVVTGLMVSIGWRGAFFALAVMALIVALPMFLVLVRDLPSQHHATNAAEREYIGQEDANRLIGEKVWSDWGSLAKVFKNHHFWILWVTFIVSSVASFGLGGWLPSFLKSERHFSPTIIAAWVSASWGISALVALLTTWLGDKTKRFSLLGIIGLIIAGIVLWLSAHATSANVAAPLVAIGLATSLVPTYLTPGLLQEYFGAALQGRAGGTMVGLSNLLSGFAPLVMGILVAAGHGSFTGAIVFIVAIIAAGAVGYAILLPDEIRHNRQVAAETAQAG